MFLCISVFGRAGGEAAGAAGRQHSGREDGEQDADGGERHRHGQHHLPELHGLPGGDCQGTYHWMLQSSLFSHIFVPNSD